MHYRPSDDRSQGRRLYRLDRTSPISLAASIVRKKLSQHFYFTDYTLSQDDPVKTDWRNDRADFALTQGRIPSPDFFAVFDRVVRIVQADNRLDVYAVGSSLFFGSEHYICPKRHVLKRGLPPCPF